MSDTEPSTVFGVPEAEKILRIEKVRTDTKFLIKWKGHHVNSATWKSCKKLETDSERFVVDQFLKSMSKATAKQILSVRSPICDLNSPSSSNTNYRLPSACDEISDDNTRHDGYTDDEGELVQIPMFHGDRVYTNSEVILSKHNSNPTVRLTRKIFHEATKVQESSCTPSRAVSCLNLSSKKSTSPRLLRRTFNTPPENPLPIDPVADSPIKRYPGRPLTNTFVQPVSEEPNQQLVPCASMPVVFPRQKIVKSETDLVPITISDSDSSIEFLGKSVRCTNQESSPSTPFSTQSDIAKPKEVKRVDPCSLKNALNTEKHRSASTPPCDCNFVTSNTSSLSKNQSFVENNVVRDTFSKTFKPKRNPNSKFSMSKNPRIYNPSTVVISHPNASVNPLPESTNAGQHSLFNGNLSWFGNQNSFNNNEAPRPVPPPKPNRTIFDDLSPPPPVLSNDLPVNRPIVTPNSQNTHYFFDKQASTPKSAQHPRIPCSKPVMTPSPRKSENLFLRSESQKCLSTESNAVKRPCKSFNNDNSETILTKKARVRSFIERVDYSSSLKLNPNHTTEARLASLSRRKVESEKKKSANVTARLTPTDRDPRIRQAIEKQKNERILAKQTFFECIKNLRIGPLRSMDIDYSWLHSFDKSGNTVLHALAKCGGGDKAVALLRFFVTNLEIDVDTLNQVGDTPLHLALCCNADNNYMIHTLLQLGADANRICQSCEQASPLVFAYDRGNVEAAKALLIHGANPYYISTVEQYMKNREVPNGLRAIIFDECWKLDHEEFKDSFQKKTGHLIESSVFVHPLGPSVVFSYEVVFQKFNFPSYSKFRIALLEFGELSSSGVTMIDRPPYDIFDFVAINNKRLPLYQKNTSRWVFDASSIFLHMMKYPNTQKNNSLNVVVKLRGSVLRSKKFIISALLQYDK